MKPKMKVKVLNYQPVGVVVKDLETGKKIKYAKQFFKKRYDLGLIEVANPKAIGMSL